MEQEKPCDSVGILTKGYAQIIAFRDENAFLEILEANPHLEPLYGTKDDEKRLFPGLYLAGYIKGGKYGKRNYDR